MRLAIEVEKLDDLLIFFVHSFRLCDSERSAGNNVARPAYALDRVGW